MFDALFDYTFIMKTKNIKTPNNSPNINYHNYFETNNNNINCKYLLKLFP